MSGTSIVEYITDVSRRTLLGSTLNGPTCTIGVLVLNAPNAVELLNLELRSSHSLIYHGK